MEVVEIPLERIHPSRLQMRLYSDPEDLRLLAESLRREGQLRPVKVRPHPELAGEFELVFGHRTLEAARMAGLRGLLVTVEELDDEEVMWHQWAENEYREDVPDIDRARWMRRMIEDFGYTQTELAGRLGRDKSWVSRHLRMLELEGLLPVGNLIKLSEWQARVILQSPRELWPRILERIEEFHRSEGILPSAERIRDFAWEASMERELRCYEEKEEEAPPAPEALRSRGGEVEAAVGDEVSVEVLKPEETPREFIRRTREVWPGCTDEFLLDSLMTRFGLSEEEARRELEAYDRERYGPSAPKVRPPTPQTTRCPLCDRPGAELLTLQVRVEELRGFDPELRAWEWILRELGGVSSMQEVRRYEEEDQGV